MGLVGVSTGRVCAQPGLDSIVSGGEDFNLQPTRMQFQIKRVGSYRISSFPISSVLVEI